MDIVAIVISIFSIFITGFFTFYFNSKLNTHETKNRVKETMSIEKYRAEKNLYADVQYHLSKLDNIIDFELRLRHAEIDHEIIIKELRDIHGRFYDFWMNNQSNITKEISDQIGKLLTYSSIQVRRNESLNDDTTYQSTVEKIKEYRLSIYDLVRKRLFSIDINEENE